MNVRLLFIFFLLLIPIASQAQAVGDAVIVGDTGVVNSIRICDPSCLIDFYANGKNSHFIIEYPADRVSHYSEYVPVLFIPTDTSLQLDTAYVYLQFGYHGRFVCCQGGSWTPVYVGQGLSDSLVRIRPHIWTLDLTGDASRHGWFGSGMLLFDNNVAAQTTYSDWLILSDTAHAFVLKVFDGANEISHYTAKAFERKKHLTYRISSQHGPTYSDGYSNAMILTRVTTGTKVTIDTETISVDLGPEPFSWEASATPNSIDFVTDPSTADSIRLLVHLPRNMSNFRYTSIGLPFRLRETSRTDSSIEFFVSGSALGGGVYKDDLAFYGSLIDINGSLRLDSLHVPLQLTVRRMNEPTYWQATALRDSGIQYLSSNSTKVIASFEGRGLASIDRGGFWSKIYGPDTLAYIFQIDDFGLIYTISPSSLYTFRDGSWSGRSVTVLASGDNYSNKYESLDPDRFWASNTGRLFAIGRYRSMEMYDYSYSWQVLRSNDHGNTWQGVTGLETIAGNWNGNVCADGILIDSTGRGETPGCTLTAFDSTSRPMASGVDVDGNYFTGVDNKLYESTDLGYSWQRIHNFGAAISAIAASPDGTVWVGTHGTGVYASTDHGASFSGVNGGLGSLDINCLNVQRGGKLYAGTRDKGLFRSLIDMPLGQSGVKQALPASATLTCFPNPAKNQTQVDLTLTHAMHVRLELLDLLGRTIEVPMVGSLASGEHTASIKTQSLLSGIYFLRLETNASVVTQKLLIAR